MAASLSSSNSTVVIRTPDQRLRVFVSSTLKELAEERQAVRQAITSLRLAPVMFESGARPHPARSLYQAYLSQSHIFIGVYWQSYGWVGPDMQISGLEDEYNLAAHKPALIYVKTPAESREPRLTQLLDRIKQENAASYKYFSTCAQLGELVQNDLVLVLTEYFESASNKARTAAEEAHIPVSNVPAPRNPLIGRERELVAATDLLSRRDSALVTLVGAAGAGKSRLGIEIARNLQNHFADGAYLVTLESIQDAQLVIPAIAKALDLTETAGRQSLTDTLKAYLSGRQMLLLLDNFEHVLPAAPRIADLLEAAPGTKIIATSRAPLRIRPERELSVGPLALPPREHTSDPEQLSQYAAIQLFVQRAQSVMLDFRLTGDNAAAVAEICLRLDGLPLAIELAAARIRVLSPQALLNRLRNRFALLRGDTRDLPRRHRTLYEAIDWSYNLLIDGDRRLLRYLSLFIGGWTLESAEAVCNAEGEEPIDVFDGLDRLMNNSLIKPSEEVHGEVRMRHFESIRDFAHNHLIESGEAAATTDRYRAYFLGLAERAENGLLQSSPPVWHWRIEAELDNLRAVMSSALEMGKNEDALRIATALWRFWWRHGYWNEGLRWLKAGLRSSNALPVKLQAKALTQAGWLCRYMGDLPQSITVLEESLTLWQQINDQGGHATALANLAASVIRHGDTEGGITLAQEALALSRQNGELLGTYFSLQVLGHAANLQGNIRKAIELFSEALALAQQAGDDDHSANLLNDLGDEYMTEGDYEKAEGYLSRAAILAQQLGNRFVSAYIAGNRGAIALRKGSLRQAFDLLSESMSILREMGDRENAILCLEAFSYIAKGSQLPDRAARLLGANETLRKAIGFTRAQAMQTDWDLAVSELASQLGKPAFEAAWVAGSSMTYDQAISYAIDRSWRPQG